MGVKRTCTRQVKRSGNVYRCAKFNKRPGTGVAPQGLCRHPTGSHVYRIKGRCGTRVHAAPKQRRRRRNKK